MDPLSASATQIRQMIASGERSAEEIARLSLDRARALQPVLNAFVDILDDEALEQARRIDARVHGGETLARLAGVPVLVKDNICVEAGRTTCGSRFLESYRSPFAASVVERLRSAGAVIIAKTNMDEFGMGSSGEHSAFGPTCNPWDTGRVPGGSSSGTAAGVAAGVAPIGLGTDTGGSIRQPASLCGLVGVRPTYGRVSRWGLVAFASSLDQIGPFARTSEDAALALSVISGHDPRDSTSAQIETPNFMTDLERGVEPLVIGVPRQAHSHSNHSSVALALDTAVEVFEGLGARIVEVDLASTDHAIAAYYLVATAEASSNLARFDGVRFGRRGEGATLDELYERSRGEGFGEEVQRRIMLGTHALSAGYADQYYATALKARRVVKEEYERAFVDRGAHAILMPTAPEPAFELGTKTDDPLSMYLEDVYTVGPALAGLPAVSFQGGFASVGEGDRERALPVGLQVIGPALGEGQLLRVVRMFERVTEHHARRPEI